MGVLFLSELRIVDQNKWLNVKLTKIIPVSILKLKTLGH